ncbi:MAG: hypothetical protein OXE99_13925, partial [Cellvibrionales bacterium]|nr:hypothetical protein [Cellvibrionales bacterium]
LSHSKEVDNNLAQDFEFNETYKRLESGQSLKDRESIVSDIEEANKFESKHFKEATKIQRELTQDKAVIDFNAEITKSYQDIIEKIKSKPIDDSYPRKQVLIDYLQSFGLLGKHLISLALKG